MSFAVVFTVSSSVQSFPNNVRAKGQTRPPNSTHTHTHPFNGPLSGTTQLSRYQKSKTNVDFTAARE